MILRRRVPVLALWLLASTPARADEDDPRPAPAAAPAAAPAPSPSIPPRSPPEFNLTTTVGLTIVSFSYAPMAIAGLIVADKQPEMLAFVVPVAGPLLLSEGTEMKRGGVIALRALAGVQAAGFVLLGLGRLLPDPPPTRRPSARRPALRVAPAAGPGAWGFSLHGAFLMMHGEGRNCLNPRPPACIPGGPWGS